VKAVAYGAAIAVVAALAVTAVLLTAFHGTSAVQIVASHAPSSSPAAAAPATAPVTAAPIPATQAPPATLVDCGQSVSQPPSITFTCGDGGAGIGGLAWSGWGTPVATASGSVWSNDCIPDCGQGTFNSTPGSVTIEDLQDGVYQQVTISAPGTSYDGMTEPLR
jgi:eukaryotic-like serine/threonine-protein kinase